jgi:hypothetical protein
MLFVPAFQMVRAWMDSCGGGTGTDLRPAYDDVLDVFRALLGGVPVDEDWYKGEYPAISESIARKTVESAAAHYRNHGHFEGRRPFAPGWRHLESPVPFCETQTRLAIAPARGRVFAHVEREVFVSLIKNIIRAVAVDAEWYCRAYPAASEMIRSGRFASASDHYVQVGYFEGKLPFEITVDEDWYISRYKHVRNGIALGRATSAKDHFLRIGYGEGCRPVPR